MVKGAESGGPEKGPESKQGASMEVGGGRVRFRVELNPEETTIVSWKKLLKKANLSEADGPGPSALGPSFEARGDEPPTPPAAASQMNETGSSDEEDHVLDNMPDVDDYDTDDSFIDDTELKESLVHINLEKAFGELEKIVAKFRPVNQSHSRKKRLPPEIKLELAKVARIAGSCYRRIPKEVISRLMSILGHLMQITTLKRNLRAMANAGLSAKQEKYNQIQKMKQEVAEMVKSRAAGMKHKYSFDDVLENKICKLYDLYVERLEEDSLPPVQKLYEELASLWPGGFMNTNRIERAIHRAKERKGLCSFRKDQEKIQKKKNVLLQNASNNTHGTNSHEKLLSCDQGSKLASSLARTPVTSNGLNPGNPKQEKLNKLISSSNLDHTDTKPSSLLLKKKAKRMFNAEVAEINLRLEKLVISQGGKRART